MCLAVPMRITSIDGFLCTCEARGIQREVSLFMLQDEPLEPGDHVLVHVGYAIQKVSPADARASWVLFDEMFAAEDGAVPGDAPRTGDVRAGDVPAGDGLTGDV